MKYTAVILLVLILQISSAQSVEKTYETHSEEIVERINSLNTTWKAGYNSYFANYTVDRMVELLGEYDDVDEEYNGENEEDSNLLQADDIPTEFFAKDKWPRCDSIRMIRDQSRCGSCWAFSVVNAASDRLCIASNQTDTAKLSAEDLIGCCGGCGNGCFGGHSSDGYRFLKKFGITSGGLYNSTSSCKPYEFPPCDHNAGYQPTPYKPCHDYPRYKTPHCVKECIPEYTSRGYRQDKYFASKIYKVGRRVSTIQKDIMKYGSVSCVMTIYDDFFDYKSGVYQTHSGKRYGKHALKIVGWGVENDTPYWLVANQWNKYWGDNGFIKVLRGKNHCGVESNIHAAIMKPKLTSEHSFLSQSYDNNQKLDEEIQILN